MLLQHERKRKVKNTQEINYARTVILFSSVDGHSMAVGHALPADRGDASSCKPTLLVQPSQGTTLI